MQLKFINTAIDEATHFFTLGSVSFGYLDGASIFDKYQENHDVNSDIILYVSNNNIQPLKTDIINFLDSQKNVPVREDIKEKILSFCKFLDSCSGDLKCIID